MEFYAAYAASTSPIPNIYFNHKNNNKNHGSHRRSKSSSANDSTPPPPADPTNSAASKPSRTSSSSEFSCSSTEKPPGTRSRKSLSFRPRSHHTSTTTATNPRYPLPSAAPASGASDLGAAMPSSQAPPHVSTPISKHRHTSSKPPQVPLPSALLQLALPDTLQLEAPAQNTNTHTPGAANSPSPVPPPPPKASSSSSSSATNPLNTTAPRPPPKDHPPPTPRKNTHHAAMLTEPGNLASKAASSSSNRPESFCSPSTSTLYSRTMQSTSDHNLTTTSSSADDLGGAAKNRKKKHEHAFVVRNGRTYLQDPTLPYPLPVDLPELHRQNLRTLLLCQLFGGPVCSPAFASSPPSHVLEVGCGSGFWSMMCHRYFAGKGHPNISFTGIDLAPLCPAPSSPSSPSSSSAAGAGTGTASSASTSGGPSATAAVTGPDKDMHWRFVTHDIRRIPFPFADGEFDLIMLKDLSLAVPTTSSQELMEEYLRLLRPGGVLEIWESDHTVRMLRPHVPPTSTPDTEPEDHDHAASLGAYVMTANTPLSAPLNTFLVEYDAWITRALNARSISTVPCTMMGPILLQESETLVEIRSRRLAVPLSEMRWEREGVGGVVTKDGQTYISSKTSKAVREAEQGTGGRRAPLSAGQLALRRTALLTVVQGILALEPILRETAGKSLDEWDVWTGKMMADLMGGGTSWGECLEVGAWWGRKRG